MKRSHWILVLVQYGLLGAATFALWRSARRAGHLVDSFDQDVASLADNLCVMSVAVMWLLVAVLPKRQALKNFVGYCLLYPAIGLFQDQWLAGLVSIVRSYPNTSGYVFDAWKTLALVAATSLLVRVVVRGVRSRWFREPLRFEPRR